MIGGTCGYSDAIKSGETIPSEISDYGDLEEYAMIW